MRTTRYFTGPIRLVLLSAIGLCLHSCSLEEDNPGGFTKENIATSREGYRAIVNNCYFGLQRNYYGTSNFGYVTNAESDLWTSYANDDYRATEHFWFYANSSPNVTSSVYQNLWYNAYDGIGSCNDAIRLSELAVMDAEEKSEWVAEARFLRAVYYYHLVEQFNGCTITPETLEGPDYAPVKSDPLTVYQQVIIPDLLFASENLRIGTDEESTYPPPPRKAALGFLAKAYLSMIRHDNRNTAYAAEALQYARLLSEDAESGGSRYNAHLYEDYAQVFDENSNYANKEALWKHRWYSGPDGYGSSNGSQNLNLKHTYFYCRYTNFGALSDALQWYLLAWGGNAPGNFMPTQHLMSLFRNQDGTLDPRFNLNFQREWHANQSYTWSEGDVERHEKDASLIGHTLEVGDLAIKIILPEDEDYERERANRALSPYLLVDYADVYNDQSKRIRMEHTNTVTGREETENFYRYFYPSLTKFNTTNFYVVSESNRRNANLDNVLIMRMAEVYLLAAEADYYVNGGANALTYLNRLRARAGAQPLSGTVTLRMIMDESGRELCGEDTRFYDLKRWGALEDANYLSETHPELAGYYQRNYVDRPIPQLFISSIENGQEYQNPGY
ncbi:MAG: RagB/SusD family nutrient uptake outer membrane protein [Rikenellaceae bacterium]|nr:RagB/SusD family nutrient uptake outer membrane protein [Rikenellaceae bacterium]